MAIYRYPATKSTQREAPGAPRFILFSARVSEVLQWALIARLEDVPGAPQRSRIDAKRRSIKKFLGTDERNTIPPAVIVTVDSHLELEPGLPTDSPFVWLKLDVPDGEYAGIVIDGQHRLLGMCDFDENIKVNIVAMLGANDDEKAFQFMVINNKATKVPTDHVRALSLQFNATHLDERLRAARLNIDPNVRFVKAVDNDPESPFYKKISWPTNPAADRWVYPAAIESIFTNIQQQKIPPFADDDDNLVEYIYAIWGAIKDRWPELWHADSSLLTKVGVVCMTQYVSDLLVNSYDLGNLDIENPDAVRRIVEDILSHQEPTLWTAPWIRGSLDNPSGRSMIVNSLIQVARNKRGGRRWFEDVPLIDATQLPPEA